MPIYEFYCVDCHTVFSFFARTIHTTKRPACPRCGRPKLERRMSRFAISKGRPEGSEGDEGLPDIDESKMEQAMAQLASEAEGVDEDNPRQVARMMRKLLDSAGMPLGGNMEEAIRRMEAGEDPEKIEEEMGDLLDGDDLFQAGLAARRRAGKKKRPPNVDPQLYDL